jgi:general secretion pathway protein D
MIGLEPQLAIVNGLIDTLDVVQKDLRTMRLYDIQHVGAEEVRETLSEHVIVSGGSRSRSSTSSRITSTAAKAKTSKSAPASASSASVSEPLVEEPQVVIIESTNSLLVNATQEQHGQIATIIGYVDRETLDQAIPYEIYSLEVQPPEDLAGVLNQLINETIKDKEGKVEKVIKKGEEDIVIVPDEKTFSLIVYASRKNQEWIRKLIRQLDKRRPQVLIDVSLVEITRDDEFSYDLNIIANAKQPVSGNIAIADKSGEGATGLPFSDALGNLEAGWNLTNLGKIQAFYAEDKIQALLTAMDKKSYGRVLAKPKILVNDNEEGIITTTQKTYVGTETQSFPGEGQTPVTTVDFTPYEAKIELKITPNISEGNLLRLEIDMLREDFEKQTDRPPDYATSNINTIVTVPDGSTIILGGQIKLKQSKGGSKVPILGDIPLVGALFRTVDNNDESNKLYVFVKATILRPDDTVGLGQLKEISERNKLDFEKAERKFQGFKDVPGIKPEPLEPVRLVEAGSAIDLLL